MIRSARINIEAAGSRRTAPGPGTGRSKPSWSCPLQRQRSPVCTCRAVRLPWPCLRRPGAGLGLGLGLGFGFGFGSGVGLGLELPSEGLAQSLPNQLPEPHGVHACIENKRAQPSASWLSQGLLRRQITPQAAPSSGQPRPTSRLGRAGRPYGPCSRQRRIPSSSTSPSQDKVPG